MTGKAAEQTADVYKDQIFAGKIKRTNRGSVFEYDNDYIETAGPGRGIAYNLPCAKKRYETIGVNLHTFFAGLLPEGLRLEALTRAVKTSKDDLLSLLMAAGADCIGDVSVVAEHRRPDEVAPDVDIKNINNASFAELFKKSISLDAAGGGIAQTITLPGIQNKISAGIISFPVRARGKNRAYILKLNPPDKPNLVQNEYFFLAMAKDLKLQAARAEIATDRNGEKGLLVERFDRIFKSHEKHPCKVHQEDACQFLDRYPADKYAQVSCRMIAEGIETFCSVPIVEVAKFLRLVAFSYIIGNGDLHAKNISIFTSPIPGRTELTPAYDLLSTIPYGDNKMALKFEGRDDDLKRGDFINFGKRHGVRSAVVESMLDEMCEGAMKRMPSIEEIGFSGKTTRHLVAIMAKRIADLTDNREKRVE